MGAHALYNDPVLLAAGSEDLAQMVLLVAALVAALLLGPLFSREETERQPETTRTSSIR